MARKENNQTVNLCLADVFKEQIDHLDKRKSQFTANNYRNVYRSVLDFVGDRQAARFNVTDITDLWLHGYIMHMQENGNLSLSSVDNYCRVLRAVYNKAVKIYSIPVGSDHPFADIHIPVPPTLKRSLAKEGIYSIINLDLSARPELEKARDLFLFLFYARGMCFVDVFNLRYDSINGEYICYRRSKTSAPLQVKIVKEMREILDRYHEEDSPYLFPFLRRNRYNGKEIAEKSSLRRINRQLNKIGKMMGLKLTTYVARHSWASLLEECGFATSVISNGMGHGSERTTKKYLKGMPSQVIDNANEEMLNRLIRRNPTEDEKKCLLLSKNETSAVRFFEPLVIKGYLLANVRVII